MKTIVVLGIIAMVVIAMILLDGVVKQSSPTPTPTPVPIPTSVPTVTVPPLEKITVEEFLRRYYNSEDLAGKRFQISLTVYAPYVPPDVSTDRVVAIAKWEGNPVWFFLYFRADNLKTLKAGEIITFKGEFTRGGAVVMDGKYGAAMTFKNCSIIK